MYDWSRFDGLPRGFGWIVDELAASRLRNGTGGQQTLGRHRERRSLRVPIRVHADDPDLLRQAIVFTAREAAFNTRLVEKDYFCSVVLEYLAASRVGRIKYPGG